MKHVLMGAAVIAALTLGLAGCTSTPTVPGSGGASDGPPPASQDTVSQNTVSQPPVVDPVAPSQQTVVTPDPPVASQPTGDESFIDSSSTAESNFFSWWNYEVQEPSDAATDQATVYQDGKDVCDLTRSGDGVTVIVQAVSDQFGFTGSGAEAVVKAAYKGLCPTLNTGFKTAFDSRVADYMNQMAGKINYGDPQPNEIDYGLFMKTVCNRLASAGENNDITNYMAGQTTLRLSQSVPENVLLIEIHYAGDAGCSALDMPPAVIAAS